MILISTRIAHAETPAVAVAPASDLVAVWNSSAGEKVLKTWTNRDLAHIRQSNSREKDPKGGAIVNWRGVLLSQIVDQALAELPPETKAQVDLVVLKSRQGKQALIPRSLITKHPLLLASLKDAKAGASIESVVPWTSKPKVLSEELPLETYFLPQVWQVELTSYQEKYGQLFLKRRTDPMANRGEKIFVQNCVTCHEGRDKASLSLMMVSEQTRTIASGDHPTVQGAPKLLSRDRRALIQFLDAFRSEIRPAVSQSGSSSMLNSVH